MKHGDTRGMRVENPKPSPGSRAYSLTHDMSGKTVDNLNAPPDQTTRRYIPTGRRGTGREQAGVWTNNNGTRLGQSLSEDSDFMPSKSTGDLPMTNLQPAIHIHLHTGPPDMRGNYQKAAKLRNKMKKS